MKTRWNTWLAAGLGAAWLAAQPAAAAPLVDADDEPAPAPLTVTVPADFALDTEMVVRNWVLCVSRAFAEQLVKARETDAATALEAYEALKATKSCGRFAEMRVILVAPVVETASGGAGDARAFEALVDLAGSWASAFVVSGSLPDQ